MVYFLWALLVHHLGFKFLSQLTWMTNIRYYAVVRVVTKVFWALRRLSYWLALCGFSQLTLHAPPRMQIHLQPSCLFAHISLHNVQCVFYKYATKILQIFYKYISSQYGMHIAYSTKSDGNTFWIMIQVRIFPKRKWNPPKCLTFRLMGKVVNISMLTKTKQKSVWQIVRIKSTTFLWHIHTTQIRGLSKKGKSSVF